MTVRLVPVINTAGTRSCCIQELLALKGLTAGKQRQCSPCPNHCPPRTQFQSRWQSDVQTSHYLTRWKNVSVTIDSGLSMHQQVTNVCTSAFIELRRIGSIRQYLTTDATKTLISAFIWSKLDYCNSLLDSSSQYLLDNLQKVQNSSARLVLKAWKRDHVQPLLRKLHWLPNRSRIEYKLSSLCPNSFTDTTPDYLSELLMTLHTLHLDNSALPQIFALFVFLLWKRNNLVTYRLRSRAPHSGTRYHTMCAIPSLPLRSNQL